MAKFKIMWRMFTYVFDVSRAEQSLWGWKWGLETAGNNPGGEHFLKGPSRGNFFQVFFMNQGRPPVPCLLGSPGRICPTRVWLHLEVSWQQEPELPRLAPLLLILVAEINKQPKIYHWCQLPVVNNTANKFFTGVVDYQWQRYQNESERKLW
jgi:hypothetical protein